MSITVLAPAFYTNPEWSTRYLRLSAARHNVPVTWYGVGEPYRGWPQVQIHSLLDELRKVTTLHVLYTDSSDAVFLTDLEEIEHKYVNDLGNPEVLMSVEADGLNAGGWMAQTDCAIDALVWIRDWQHSDNPQTRWRTAVADGEIEVEKDLSRAVFQVADETLFYDIPDMPGRVTAIHAAGYPCVLHFAGGYTDLRVGKAALIEPVWRALGYEATCEVEL